jgi:hypothetical protein
MKFILPFFALFFLLLASCKKQQVQADKIQTVDLNETGFESRVSYFWDEVPTNEKSLNDKITFFHVADVASPVVNGQTTSATGMEISGNFCYVTYHIAGSVYGGAIEVFDISTPATPKLVSQLVLNDTDFNECTIVDGKLYVVGGRDIYYSKFTDNNTKGAILLEVELSEGLLTKNLRWTALPSYSGNSVAYSNNFLFVVSGSEGGGITKVNKQSMKVMDMDLFDNARYCDVTGDVPSGNVLALQGLTEPKLYTYSVNSNFKTTKQTFPLASNNVTYNGKAVLFISGNEAYVCTGEKSLFVYNINDLKAPKKEFTSLGDGLMNGVHTDKEFIYVANGYDGVIAYNKDDYSIHTKFKFDGSANYVQSNGSYIFISNGKGGLKVLRRVDPLPEKNECADRLPLLPETIKDKYQVKNKQKLTFASNNTMNDNFLNDGEFYYCGNLTIKGSAQMNNGAVTEVFGNLSVNDLIINPGSTLRIKGTLTVNGEIALKGKLEFVGTESKVVLSGKDKVKKTPGFTVVGTYVSNYPF